MCLEVVAQCIAPLTCVCSCACVQIIEALAEYLLPDKFSNVGGGGWG